jgi:hypothetical protein
MRRHCLNAFGDDLLFALRHIGFAPAMEAVLGLDAAKQQVLRATRAEDESFDPRNLHGLPSCCVDSEKGIVDRRFSGVEPRWPLC